MFQACFASAGAVRPLRLEDAGALFALITREREHLVHWVPWLNLVQSVESTTAYVERKLARQAAGNGLALVLTQPEVLVGEVGLDYIDVPNRATEIGFWIAASASGRGLVTRACRVLAAFCFENLALERIQLRAATDNVRSQAVAQRLGFRFEGVLRDAEQLATRTVSLAVYSLLRSEWQAPGAVSHTA